MRGYGRRAARFTSVVVAALLLLPPTGRALADNDQPSPTDWPTVAVIDRGSGSEPQPVDWPTPKQPS
ncbi:hypothetical protein JOF29_004831 [Kribbella aluminosa]|uniref:Uncharacterized protein n=1 Tax=Kribbella aluminosa TaxID=416017 RepID=A0ABS4UQ03_9ACTN|nr:hypothetical protein [Kribbella aluminosa]MBP2353721.1 hypothetical protein [Kribbella aluminosa]